MNFKILIFSLFIICSFNSFSQKWAVYRDSAEASFKKGKRLEACKWTDKSLKSARNTKIHDTIVSVILNSGGTYNVYAGQYQKAADYWIEAMNNSEKYFGTSSKQYALHLHNVALINMLMNKLDTAETLFQKSLQILIETTGDTSATTLKALGNLGQVYFKKGEYFKALEHLEKVISVSRKIGITCNDCYLKDLNILCDIYYMLGNFEFAEKLYLETIQFILDHFDEKHPYIHDLKRDLAGLYQTQDNWIKAEELYKQVLDWDKKYLPENHPDYASDLSNIATIYANLNLYKKAELLTREAISMTEINGIECNVCYGTMLSHLASIYSNAGDYTKADSLYHSALQFNKKKLGMEDQLSINTLFNIGSVYFKAGLTDSAKKYIEEAIYSTESKNIICDECYTNMLASLANINIIGANFIKADSLSQKALNFSESRFGLYHVSTYSAYYINTRLYNSMGNYQKANEFYLKSFNNQLYRVMIDFNFLNEKEKKLYYKETKESIEKYCSFIQNYHIQNPFLPSYLFNYRLTTKAILFNTFKRMIDQIYESNDLELMELYKTWKLKRDFLMKLNTLKNDERETFNINPGSLEDEIDSLEKTLSKKVDFFNFSKADTQKVKLDFLQKKLKGDEVLIEIIRYRDYGIINDTVIFQDKKNIVKDYRFLDSVRYAALIVTSDTSQPSQFIYLENGNDLEGIYLNNYRLSIKHKRDDFLSFNQYWAKIADALEGKKKIFFSPDGVYNQINLYTLFNPVTKKYLIDEIELTLLTNPQDIISIKDRPTRNDSLNTISLFGNIQYSSLSDDKEENHQIDFPPLPGTKKEIEQISDILTAQGWISEIYDQSMATESSIKSRHSPRYLHIATHGIFIRDNQLNSKKIFGIDSSLYSMNTLLKSGLAFAKDTGGLENGILTAYEAMNLNLQNTDMVVLSACETGLGEIDYGEGVYGLQRAFQTAGARSVVMSLWKIDDNATQELMINFYKYLSLYKDKNTALKKSQMELKKKYLQPYYWGSFVIVGR